MRFVLRGSLIALMVTVLIVAVWFSASRVDLRPLDRLPPPPTILAPRGERPIGPGGLVEFAQYGEDWFGVGCGFLLQLPGGEVIGVTTAHSLSFTNDLRQIAFGVAGRSGYVRQFDTLLGRPGVARSGDDMTVDYVLLKASAASSIDPNLILQPDPRGAPQPGERVALFSGLGDGQGNLKTFAGTVQAVNATAVLVLMDDVFDPSGVSGSPFISEHTGQVVGMTIAVSRRAGRVLLSLHPIGSIERLAQSAADFPKIKDFRR